MRFLVLILALTLSFPVMAADIAVFQRDLYDRLTFENVPAGSVTRQDNMISIPYNDALTEEEGQQLTSFGRGISAIAVNNGRLRIKVNEAVVDVRDFRIGSKVVLDLFLNMERLDALNTSRTVPDRMPAPNPQAEPKPVKQETPKPQSAPVPNRSEEPLREVQNARAPELSTAQNLPALADPTIVTVSSTSPFGLAVFKRRGRLFVVTDQATMAVPPQVAGHGSKLGWAMQDIPMEGGKAWMMPIPEGAYLRPEGRGLIWRIIISDTDPDLDTADIRRRLTQTDSPEIDILMPETSKLLRLNDPDYGDDLAVATAKRATARMNEAYDFVDFDIIPAVIGAVIKPKSDGLRLQAATQFITVSNNNGLTIAPDNQNEIVKSYLKQDAATINTPRRAVSTLDRIFYFTDWGGQIKPEDYIERRKELDGFLVMAKPDNKLGVLLDLVKLTLSQGMGQEAMGYLDIAKSVNAQIEEASEYLALRGAAHYLAQQYDMAEDFFEQDGLKNIAEAQLWLAATKAALGEKDAALEIYADNALLTSVYPYEIKQAVLAPLARAFLDRNRGQDALPLIDLLEEGDRGTLSREERATLAYLKGRAQSVTGRPDEGISNLYKASTGDKLGPYGIRSEMLLIMDELARDVIDRDEAIKRMERLRFAWRGDSLETEIQRALGELYIENDQPRKGLNILKRAATNTGSAEERREIVRQMAEAYKSIFISEEFETLDPMVAVAVYDEFKELTPVGAEGNDLIDSLADKLMSVNLLSRATNVLKDKMDRLGGGQNAIQSGLRIASIQLLDREPEQAFETLEKVDEMLGPYRGTDKDELNSRVVLLKAKALAEVGEPQRALFMTEGLDDTDDVVKLRVDTAWRSGQWVAVTENLAKLLARQNITPAQPPTEAQAQLILNQAVALSLSNQYDALQRFAAQYDTTMKQTPFYKQFLVVTRPQNISNLADRETLMDVTSEVDLFTGVLERAENNSESAQETE